VKPPGLSGAQTSARAVLEGCGGSPSGDTGEVRGGAGGWARVKSGFIFPILIMSNVYNPE
jgi:hypothetical protein